jgi:hypothetical protein
MIRVFESFDHLGMNDDGTDSNRTSYLWNLGWRFGTQKYFDPYYAPYYVMGECNPVILNEVGRFGSRALRIDGGGIIFHQPVNRACNTLVVGVCVAPGYAGAWDNTNYSQRPTFDFRFCRHGIVQSGYEHQNFHVRVNLWQDGYQSGGYASVQCWTAEDGTGYPGISTPEYIPCPYFMTEFTYIEVYLDVTDFMNGRVKVAINNRTYIDKSGIATAAYNVFGSNPFDPRAKIDNVNIKTGYYGASAYLYDTIYVCDDYGGYQNDFLGDVFSKSFYPVGDGNKSEFMAIANSTVIDDPGNHHEYVDNDPIYPGDETTYLEADQDMTEEMLIFPYDPIPPTDTLISVNSRTLVRNVAAPGAPHYNTIVPLYQIQGNPVLATDSLAKRELSWNYYFLDVYYNLVPGFAIPWAEYLLDQSQFGFRLRASEVDLQSLEEILWDDWNTTRYDWDETIVEDLGMLDDTTESTWDVTIEDSFDTSEEPDYGEFFLEESIDFYAVLGGSVGGLKSICTGGTATACCMNGSSGYEPWRAFDGSLANYGWHSGYHAPVIPAAFWLQYELGGGETAMPSGYWMYVNTSYYWPSKWKFQAAKAGEGWADLDEQSVSYATMANGWNWFPIPSWNPNETYVKYRIYITEARYYNYVPPSNANYYVTINELKIMAPWEESLASADVFNISVSETLGFSESFVYSVYTELIEDEFTAEDEPWDGYEYIEETLDLLESDLFDGHLDVEEFLDLAEEVEGKGLLEELLTLNFEGDDGAFAIPGDVVEGVSWEGGSETGVTVDYNGSGVGGSRITYETQFADGDLILVEYDFLLNSGTRPYYQGTFYDPVDNVSDGSHSFYCTSYGGYEWLYFYNVYNAANYTVSNWSVRKCTLAIEEEAQGLLPDQIENVEIDTAQHFSGSSSLLIKSPYGGIGYRTPNVGTEGFIFKWRFRYSDELVENDGISGGIGSYSGNEYVFVELYADRLCVGAYDYQENEVINYEEAHAYEPGEWYEVIISVTGRTISVTIGEAEIASEDATIDNPIRQVNYMGAYMNTWDGEGDVWVDAMTLEAPPIASGPCLTLNFEGSDEATVWTEEAQGLEPDYVQYCEIDTAQYHSGSSSLLMGQGGQLEYIVPGIDSRDFVWAFSFRYSDDMVGGDQLRYTVFDDNGGGYIAITLTLTTIFLEAFDYQGTQYMSYVEVHAYGPDAWHDVEVTVSGKNVSIKINSSTIVTEEAAVDNPMMNADLVTFQVWLGESGADAWLDDVSITKP